MAFLRFNNLGHSDYISDEPATFFYRGGKKDPTLSPIEYILTRRKGPLQLFVGYIPYMIMGDYTHELAQRIPFALFNLLSVVVFYFLVKKLTKNTFVSFVSSFLFGVNGLILAYGRIAQYESLNMFFSFSALYFYACLDGDTKSLFRNSFLGTICLSLSFLAHWDAIYILLPLSFVLLGFLKRKDLSRELKIKLLGANFFLGCLLILPFLVPYLIRLRSLPKNVNYADSILGLALKYGERADLFQFKLYNPFLAFWLYAILGFVGLWFGRKSPIFVFWGLGIVLVFRFFIKYSGLHFYNVFPPTVVLVAFGLYELVRLPHKFLKMIGFGLTALILGFLYYQSFLLFVDSKVEYPWEREKLVFFGKTQKYTHADEMRHKTGFPHKRYWKEINSFVNEQNALYDESFGYYTNEYRPHSRFYMDADFRDSSGFYAIGIKRPLSFATDYKFPQIKNKETVYKIKNDFDETVVRIYRVEPN